MRSDAGDPADLDVPGGVGPRDQWRTAGASARMFTDGRLVRVAKTVYALPGVLESPVEVARLVGALAPPGATVSGWAAAVLHGVRDAGPTMLRRSAAPIQLCLSRQDHRAPEGFDALRVDLAAGDIETVDGVRVTTLERTAYDMVRFCRHLPTAVALLDAFRCQLNPRPLDVAALHDLARARPRGRGHPVLRRAIALSSERSRSMKESTLRARLLAGLDLDPGSILVNATLRTSRGTWELDLVDIGTGLAMEYDSAFHATLEQRERDALKDLEVGEQGLTMLRINAATLGAADATLIVYVDRGRRRSLAAGGASAAARLIGAARLGELPLRDYRPSAVE